MAYARIVETITDSISQSKSYFSKALFLTIFNKVLISFIPIILGQTIDLIPLWETKHQQVVLNLSSFLIFWILIVLISPLQSFSLAQFTQQTVFKKTMEWFQSFFEKDFNFFFENNAARVTNIIERGIHAYEKLLNHFCETMLPTIIELIIMSIFLAYYGGLNVLLLVVVLGCVQVHITLKMIKARRHLIDEINEIEDNLAEDSNELLNRGFIFQIYSSVEYVINRLKKGFHSYALSSAQLTKSGSHMSLVSPSFQYLSTFLGLILGIIYFRQGRVSVGEVIILISLLSRFSAVLGEGIGAFRVYDQFLADIQELDRLNEWKSGFRDGQKLECITSFTLLHGIYSEGETEIQIPQTLDFKISDKVAIVGPSGAGKSTLLGLLFGISDESRKKILWNAIPLEKIHHQSQLDFSSYCPQGTLIFSGTAEENLLHLLKSVNQNASTLEDLEITHLFQRDEVCERNISGGEAKRLSLARCLLKKSQVRFFDEPTAGLNPEMAQKAWSILFNKNTNHTITFCATHDFSTIDQFNRILLLKNKTVYEINHKEFLELNGLL